MNKVESGFRQLFFAVLILVFAAWTSGEWTQWMLRWRAEKLLTEVRALDVNHAQWTDAQNIMQRWNKWGAPVEGCTAEKCNYRVSLIQSLPPMLIGYSDEGMKNWIPRIVYHLGLRNVAVRGGFTVENGIVTAKWFGEQVTPPVGDWGLHTDYIPYLSVLSSESSKFKDKTEHSLQQPSRAAEFSNMSTAVSFTPDEEPGVKAALMDFQLSCLTQLKPCRSEYDILPEGLRLTQNNRLSTR